MWPEKGIMFVRCGKCSATMPPVVVAVDDPCNGAVSHGLCGKCEADAYAEMRDWLKLEIELNREREEIA